MLVYKKHRTQSSTVDFDLDEAAKMTSAFLLSMLAAGSIVISGSIQPGILSFLKSKTTSKRHTQDQLKNSFYNSKRRKFIEIIRIGDDKVEVRLTNKGKERVREFSFGSMKIKKPLHWDKKWRILIFDIPTKPKIYNAAREALRNKIKELGFHQLQKSVWVYPYECEDEILLIAELYHVQKHIEIITAEKILHENVVKKVFKL